MSAAARCTTVKKILTPIAAILLTAVLIGAAGTLLASNWLRSTVFSSGWYQQALSQQAYVTELRAAIEDDLKTQGAYVGIPVEVLIRGLDNDQIYLMLRKHIDNTVDYLDYRAAYALPVYPAERFYAPILDYAQELGKSGSLTMTAQLEKQLQQIADDSALIVQKQVGILNLTVLQKSSMFQSLHRLLFAASHLALLSGAVMLTAMAFLFLLFFHQIRRSLQYILVGFWLTGALIGVPLLVLDLFALPRRLSISTANLKFAIDELLTSGIRNLMLPSLILLTLTSVSLLVLFILAQRVQEDRHRSGRHHTENRSASS